MNFSKYQIIGVLGVSMILGTAGCSNLDDTVYGRISATSASSNAVALDPASSLQGVYQQLNTIATNQGNTYAMEEHPSDEMMGPTRGTDWDDFGQWRKLHQHTWDPSHPIIIGTWNDLNSGVFRATQTISIANATTQQKAEASFLRAFYMFYLVDMFGQVPFRLVTDDADANPKVFSRKDASNYVITDLRYAYNNLASGAPNVATKEAAATMLAKMYLNRAVYNQAPESPSGPFTFAKADMDSSIYFSNAVINSGKFTLTAAGKYFDNFHWENDSRSKELIFTIVNTAASQPGNVRNRYYMTLHYNQYVNAWNGFTTLADFYNSFDAKDERRGGSVSDLTPVTGLTSGFLVGQQYNVDTLKRQVPVLDRSGKPLQFTPDVNIAYALENKGIRVIKYLPQPGAVDNPANDYVFLRYADVLLMKAEAILRGGTDPAGQTAAQIVNNLRTTRGAAAATAVDLSTLLTERGHELYWEGWRRNDQIRFGTFLDPVDQRPSKSPATAVLFPIPQQGVDSNPNLKQNRGY